MIRLYPILQILLADAQGISPQTVSGTDAQLLQDLLAHLPSLLSLIGSAITQLGPSINGTPDSAAIHSVAGLLGTNGPIGQAVNSLIQPVASHPGPGNAGGGSGGGSGGGNGDEITISGYTTIPSHTDLGSLPTSGPSAVSALRPAASQLGSALDAASSAASSLASDLNGGGSGDGGGAGSGGKCGGGGILGLLKSLTCLLEGQFTFPLTSWTTLPLCVRSDDVFGTGCIQFYSIVNSEKLLTFGRCLDTSLGPTRSRVELLQCRRCP